MAQVFGEPGRNATTESFARFRRFWLIVFLSLAGSTFIVGYGVGSLLPVRHLPWWLSTLINVLLLTVMFTAWRVGSEKLEEFDRERIRWRKGAIGEALIAGLLEDLPDGFVVVNDISQKFGNIDHVVIGPTGVYVIDTKNWKGAIAADGRGELVVNGKSLSKPIIRNILNCVMDFQNKIKALTESDYFIRGVIVFSNAHVDASFGSTGHIHCLGDERLLSYIQDQPSGKRLSNGDIERIKQATLQLAGMDKRFAVITEPFKPSR